MQVKKLRKEPLSLLACHCVHHADMVNRTLIFTLSFTLRFFYLVNVINKSKV